MSVQFQDDQYYTVTENPSVENPKTHGVVTKILIGLGIARNAQQAMYIELGIVLMCMLTAIFFLNQISASQSHMSPEALEALYKNPPPLY